MTLCTDGNRFKVDKIGVAVIYGGYLYSCDALKCPKCHKTVLGNMAQAPLAVYPSEEAEKMIDRLLNNDVMVYGLQNRKD